MLSRNNQNIQCVGHLELVKLLNDTKTSFLHKRRFEYKQKLKTTILRYKRLFSRQMHFKIEIFIRLSLKYHFRQYFVSLKIEKKQLFIYYYVNDDANTIKLNKMVFVLWQAIYKVRCQFKIFGGHLGRHLGFFKTRKGDSVSYSRFLERTPFRTF